MASPAVQASQSHWMSACSPAWPILLHASGLSEWSYTYRVVADESVGVPHRISIVVQKNNFTDA